MKAVKTNEWDQYVKEMLRLCQYVGQQLHLEGWRFTYHFHEDCNEENSRTVADIKISDAYFTALINFYKPAYKTWKEKDIEGLKGYIVHEFCHILTNQLTQLLYDEIPANSRSYVERANEQSTERICRIMLSLNKFEEFQNTLKPKGCKK